MAGIYLILLLLSLYMPIIGPFMIFVLPVPFAYYAHRHGWKPGALVFLVALIFSLLFATVISPVTLLAGIGGLFLGGAMHKKRGSYETLAIGSVGFIIGIVLLFLATQFVFDVNWIDDFNNNLEEGVTSAENLLSGVMDEEQVEQQIAAMREQIAFLPDIMPSILAMTGIVLAFLNQWITYKVINRVEKKSYRFVSFKNFRLPSAVLWYYLIALILNLIVGDGGGLLYLAAINIFTLTGTLIVIQGFSFVFFYAGVKKWSKAIPVVLIVFTLLLPQLMLYLVRILGIIDLGFPLRERLGETKDK